MIFEPELCALAATAFSIYVCTRIMLLVMCACVVHARQVIPYLQESILYEHLTREVWPRYVDSRSTSPSLADHPDHTRLQRSTTSQVPRRIR